MYEWLIRYSSAAFCLRIYVSFLRFNHSHSMEVNKKHWGNGRQHKYMELTHACMARTTFECHTLNASSRNDVHNCIFLFFPFLYCSDRMVYGPKPWNGERSNAFIQRRRSNEEQTREEQNGLKNCMAQQVLLWTQTAFLFLLIAILWPRKEKQVNRFMGDRR